MGMRSKTLEGLKEVASEALNYDPLTGVLSWKVRRGQRGKPGTVAGSLQRNRYGRGRWVVQLHGQTYAAPRLIWLLQTGAWPEEGLVIDHINGDALDNRWGNLRAVSQQVNCHNFRSSRKTSPVGLVGVTRKVSKRLGERYTAIIMLEGRRFYLGTYDEPFLAFLTYAMMKLRLGFLLPQS